MAQNTEPAKNLPSPGLPPELAKMLGIQTEPIFYEKIPFDDLRTISNMLEDYHKIFYTFFEMASISYTNALPTACIRFRRFGKPDMLINKGFWQFLTPEEQCFVIIHECLHVILDHGVRNGKHIAGATPYLVNIAQDITINEMAVDIFGVKREDLRNWKNYCWIATCFEDPRSIKRNETFTYYLEMLIKHASEDVKSGSKKTMDQHEGIPPDAKFEPMTPEEEDKVREKIAKDLAEDLTADELEKVKSALPDGDKPGGKQAGSMRGSYQVIIERKTKPPVLRIHKLIAKLKRTRVKMTEKVVETFVQHNRRFASILRHNADIHMPGEATYDKPKKDKLLVALYMDISGSCVPFIPLFKKVLAAFLNEHAVMDVVAHTFDTRVQRVQFDTPIYGGGGTAFGIIEEQNRKLEEEFHRYPDCVVVITDGYGDQVSPKAPKRWIWLLTPGNTKQYIHSQSKAVLTKDVIFE